MSRLCKKFSDLSESGEKALVCYVVAGDPNIARTHDIILALDRAGVDVIELGIPFSDPLADGPSIQLGSQRALANGVSVQEVLDLVAKVRLNSDIPIVLMTYFNPVMRFGVERFAMEASKAGADGVIQTDLTPEEANEWVALARAHDLDTIFLVAPTSTEARIQVVSGMATGFVYAVSRTGVTGARSSVPAELPEMISRIRKSTSTPVCVGFGISSAEHVSVISQYADGVVVGSALVDLIGKTGDIDELGSVVEVFARDLKQATHPVTQLS